LFKAILVNYFCHIWIALIANKKSVETINNNTIYAFETQSHNNRSSVEDIQSLGSNSEDHNRSYVINYTKSFNAKSCKISGSNINDGNHDCLTKRAYYSDQKIIQKVRTGFFDC
jgi:hypothetical protein